MGGAFIGIFFLLGLAGIIVISHWDELSREWGLKKFTAPAFEKALCRKHLQDFPYFQRLSAQGQNTFIDRVIVFMYNKEFEGREGLRITEQMKVLISAAAVQLTFGLERYMLGNIKKILIYPKTFFGSRGKEYKGLTSVSGQMLLSWQDFREGYHYPNDRYNLGLHEMSHALQLNLYIGTGLDKHFGSYIDTWKDIAQKEFDKMQRHKEPSFLRAYAATNINEFFAVCIEHFFETPEEFRKALPDVYNHMVVLLNQNPLNASNDYKVDDWFRHDVNRNFGWIPVPAFIKKNFKYSSWHWSLSLMLIAIVAGPLSILRLYHVLVIPPLVMILLFILCGCIGLYQKKYFRQLEVLSGKYFMLYSFTGFGACLFLAILWLNYLVPISGEIREEYRVLRSDQEYKTSRHNATAATVGYTVSLEDGAYASTPAIRFIRDYHNQPRVGFIFRRGLFGVKVLQDTYYPPGEN
jgi:MtfA peptidase